MAGAAPSAVGAAGATAAAVTAAGATAAGATAAGATAAGEAQELARAEAAKTVTEAFRELRDKKRQANAPAQSAEKRLSKTELNRGRLLYPETHYWKPETREQCAEYKHFWQRASAAVATSGAFYHGPGKKARGTRRK